MKTNFGLSKITNKLCIVPGKKIEIELKWNRRVWREIGSPPHVLFALTRISGKILSAFYMCHHWFEHMNYHVWHYFQHPVTKAYRANSTGKSIPSILWSYPENKHVRSSIWLTVYGLNSSGLLCRVTWQIQLSAKMSWTY